MRLTVLFVYEAWPKRFVLFYTQSACFLRQLMFCLQKKRKPLSAKSQQPDRQGQLQIVAALSPKSSTSSEYASPGSSLQENYSPVQVPWYVSNFEITMSNHYTRSGNISIKAKMCQKVVWNVLEMAKNGLNGRVTDHSLPFPSHVKPRFDTFWYNFQQKQRTKMDTNSFTRM